jgi:hypothetical protein
VTVTLVAIIAIGFGTAIKVYLDKVSDRAYKIYNKLRVKKYCRLTPK